MIVSIWHRIGLSISCDGANSVVIFESVFFNPVVKERVCQSEKFVIRQKLHWAVFDQSDAEEKLLQ